MKPKLWVLVLAVALVALPGARVARGAEGEPTRTVTLELGKDIIPAVEGHQREVCAVAFSPNGKKFATAGRDLTVRVWDAETRKFLMSFTGHEEGAPVARKHWDWSPISRGFFSEGEPPTAAGVWALAFDPDSRLLASAGADGTVRLWSLGFGVEYRCLKGHTGDVRAVAFSPDGRFVASAGRDGDVRIWDRVTGKCEKVLHKGGQLTAVAYSPDGKLIATGCWEGPVVVWDVATGKLRDTLEGLWVVQTLAFSPDGKALSAVGESHVAIRRWDVATGNRLDGIRGNAAGVRALAYSPDGKALAAADKNGTVKFWSPEGKCLRTCDGALENRAVAYRPDGKLLAVAGDSGVVFLDPEGKLPAAVLPKYRAPLNRKAPCCIALRADGLSAATGDTLGDVKLWDASTGKNTATLGRHSAPVSAVRYSGNGKVLVSLDVDGGVRTWDLTTGKAKAILRETPAPATDRPDYFAAREVDLLMWLWGPRSLPLPHGRGRPHGRLRGHRRHAGRAGVGWFRQVAPKARIPRRQGDRDLRVGGVLPGRQACRRWAQPSDRRPKDFAKRSGVRRGHRARRS